MNPFDVAAVLILIAAASGYVNHRLLKLPATSGTLIVALTGALGVVALDAAAPAWHLQAGLARFLGEIDFNETLMHGILCFLLFAGALHVDVDSLFENKGMIAALASVGILISTFVVGVLTWGMFRLMGLDAPFVVCLVFGALISPTDPIAVMGLLKALRAPRSLEALIAGESLFNDGIAVVVFLGLVSVAGLSGSAQPEPIAISASGLGIFFIREVGGGAALGLLLGYVGYRALKSIDDPPLELLITLALAMFLYALSFWIHVSGPIAVVVAGLLIGNPGRKFAMSRNTRGHLDAFWNMVDEILNAVLFLLLGLQVFAVPAGARAAVVSVLVVPIALIARFVSVGVPVSVLGFRSGSVRGLVPVLTWSGLRGGISVAMALSLPRFPARDYLLACTYAVVVFSVLAQGLTVRRLLLHYGIGAPHD